MPLSVPLKNTGDLLTAAEFNEILNTVNDFFDSNFTVTVSMISDLAVEGTSKITVSATEPVGPSVGDIWIDTN